uniref:40S ribosomal protein S15 n=1 Tax=Percolomonas cosmopolitus TaxID=63605 RepID=A0A7S1KQV3_9EUKA|eukprot:CAMPEP_0117439704 /NCGR_PEP_ID=MMETSP0759-20121206/2701_1 /TAXON_ID=63605 /ORGANISM="Percolomonas cosmopolitus, Strain WS" /LENGTH=139 /DNA_ID=CAMNT_0005231425 /DNA_START=64 /DNA_END=483 /DNA_ORIENTATION=+
MAKQKFRTFQYRGIELNELITKSHEEMAQLFNARKRRRFNRKYGAQYFRLMQKLRNAKKDVPYGEKPPAVKTHLRDAIVLPEMIGSVLGVYNGLGFIEVEVRAEMVGHHLGEFAITYKPIRHGRPGVGATSSSKFVPLK